ncbi:MAG: hypothetical protein M1818_007211 [Claussenomyces sp. TS43310]|nr:MAG: hypothetical protein M1818_007211 [Claussenomyces sp. TS43310]
MSGATSTSAKPPKAMSSRLLTMKFMQRAAASSPISSPSIPDAPSPKRRRTGKSPGGFEIDSLADQRAVQAALASEEAIRQAALDRAGVEAGDTRWILDFERDSETSSRRIQPALRVIEAGFATIDYERPASIQIHHEGDKDLPPSLIGRKSFGRFNRAVEKLQDPTGSDSSDSDSENDGIGENSADNLMEGQGDDAEELLQDSRMEAARKLKAERKKAKKAEKAEAQRLAEKRKKKEVNLNSLTSLSGVSPAAKQICHRCGQAGHIKADCPKRRRESGDDHHHHRPAKARKSR